MKTLKTRKNVQFKGPAPIDFIFTVEKKILDNDGRIVFVSEEAIPCFETQYIVSELSLFEDDPHDFANYISLENYNSLDEALQSSYYKYFKRTDAIIDKMIADVLSQVDDTKFMNGIRFGAKIEKVLKYYGEAVVYLSKTDKYIYLQIVQTKEKVTYTVTETSVFMRLELGELYEAYYGDKPQVPFIVEINTLDNLGEYDYLKEDFENMLERLEEYKKSIK